MVIIIEIKFNLIYFEIIFKNANCCSGINDLKADHTASHLGKAQGLVTVLRGLPFNASRRIVYLPQDVMIKVGVNLDLWTFVVFRLNRY